MDIQKIREDFPILSRTVYGKPLVYFDNGATTQKPRLVVDALVDEYYSVNANVHRGVHYLSQQATELHEASRETVRQFINARSPIPSKNPQRFSPEASIARFMKFTYLRPGE